MAVSYTLSATVSDFSGGADFTKKLLTASESQSTVSVTVAPNATETSYAFTEPGYPGAGGTSTGTFTCDVFVATAASQVTVRPNLTRVNSAGVAQGGVIQPSQAAASCSSTGSKSFTWVNPALGTWNAGDRLRVGYTFASSTNQSRTLAIRTGATDAVTTPFAGSILSRTLSTNRVAVQTIGFNPRTVPARVAVSVSGIGRTVPALARVSTTGGRTVPAAVGVTVPPTAVVSWAALEVPDPPAVASRTLTPNRVAASTTGTRTVSARAAISAGPTRTVPALVAIRVVGLARTVPATIAIAAQHAVVSFAEVEVPDASATQRAIPARVAVSTLRARTLTPNAVAVTALPSAVISKAEFEVPDAPGAGGVSPRTVPARVAISGAGLRQSLLLALSWSVGGFLARTVPAAVRITATPTRTVPARVAIQTVGNARTITPTRIAVIITPARTVPAAVRVTATNTRTVPARVAVSTANARTVPSSVAVSDPGASQRIVPARVAVAVGQVARPAADVSDGAWTDQAGGTDLRAAIDEATPDDADWITSPLSPVSPAATSIRVQPLVDPSSNTGVTVRYRYGKSAATGDAIDLTVRLFDGATEIANWTHTDIPYGHTTASQTLTTNQAAAITHKGWTDGLILVFETVKGA